MEREALKVIEKHKLTDIVDIVAYLPICRATFYNKKLDVLDTIKEAIWNNKVLIVNGLKAKWYKGDNATCQIALMKLVGTKEQRDILNQNKPPEQIEIPNNTIEIGYEEKNNEIEDAEWSEWSDGGVILEEETK